MWIKRLVFGVIGLLAVIQAIRPSRTNPAVDPKNEIAAHLMVPPEVAAIFDRSCSDCHSNRTIWPSYSGVAPISWLIAYDVNHGRRALNFSEWGTGTAKTNTDALQEICKELTEKEMPGPIYPILHPTARLTESDIQTVCSWTHTAGQGVAETRQTNP